MSTLYKTISAIRRAPERAVFLCVLKFFNVSHGSFKIVGRPYLNVQKGGRMTIGDNFKLNSIPEGNAVGGNCRSVISVERGAVLEIGNNVGISSSTIVARCSIKIGDNVKIGGGTYILDSDFHSLDPEIRASDRLTDAATAKSAPVEIRENAFIGARSMILKGVTVGRNSVVGAGSVVVRSVPDNQVWAGNPARFIKNLEI